jgi:hypothetical protein
MVTLSATYLDDLGRVRLTAAALLANVSYTLQRSTDLEPTWVDVRGGGNVSTVGVTVVDDYEYTPNAVNHYRLVAPAFYDSFNRQLPPPVDEGFETLPLDVTITQGTPGDMRLRLPGAAGSRASTPDTATLDITGDIDIRATVRLNDFLSGSAMFVSKAAAGQISYQFGHQTGNLVFRGSTTGAAVNVTATCSANISTVLAYQREWITVRFTRVAATGVGTFYYTRGSINNSGPWTQLGSTAATTTGNLFSGTGTLWVGEDQLAGLSPMNGGVRRVQIRNGINSTVVTDPNFAAQASGTVLFNDTNGLAWSVVGSAAITDAISSSAAWARTNTEAHTGTWSLKSGTITDNQVSDAVVTLPAGTASLQFWYKIDSEENKDYLQVFKDSTFVMQVTGAQTWAQSAMIDVTGATTVAFRYYKDAASSSGADAAWIDDLDFEIAGSTGTTWGTADTGQAYTTFDVDANAYMYVNNGVGVIGDPNPVTDVAELHADTDPAAVNAEVTYSVIQPAATLDQAVEYNVGLRGTDQNNYYESQILFGSGGSRDVSLRIAKWVGGVYTGLTVLLSVGEWTANIPWNVRYRVNGTGLMMRAWAYGTDEPRDWQLFVSDTTFATGSDIHIRGRKDGGAAYEQWFGPIEVRAIPDLVAAIADISPTQDDVWLKSVAYPLFNQQIECTDWDAISYDSRVGLYDIKGRHEILAITDVGSSGSFGLTFVTRSAEANRAVLALLTYGGVLLLQPPGDTDEDCPTDYSGLPEGYIVPTASVRPHSIHGQPIWVWEVSFTQVAAMDAEGIIPTTITWEMLWALIGEDGTWETVWATWPTWQELWLTQGNIEDFG